MSGGLSTAQWEVLRALDKLTAPPAPAPSAREISAETGRSVDSVASTLRSLTARDLVTHSGRAASGWGYLLTGAGRVQARSGSDGIGGKVHYNPGGGQKAPCGRPGSGKVRTTRDPHQVTCQSCRHSPLLDGALGNMTHTEH
jgi:hypothetical protein